HQRRFFPRDRSARPTVHRKWCARIIGKNRRRTHHHCARGLNMLRGFLVIFVLCGIAIVAVFGFRGQKSTAPPTEVFPDMVRQMKVRAKSPLGLFAGGAGPRLPVAGTVPIGYEMPKPEAVAGSGAAALPGSATPAPVTWSHPQASFSSGTDYVNTGKMGDHWGTGIPVPVTPELMERGQQRFSITCAMCHGATAAAHGIT